MSLKLNNENKIWHKKINKTLTLNNEWRYLAIHNCCTKKMKIFERRKLLFLLALSSNQKCVAFFSVPSE